MEKASEEYLKKALTTCLDDFGKERDEKDLKGKDKKKRRKEKEKEEQQRGVRWQGERERPSASH